MVDAQGDLHTLSAWGAMLGYRHQWNEKWRSTVSYSYVQLDTRSSSREASPTITPIMPQANIIWAVTKNMYVGLEYLSTVGKRRVTAAMAMITAFNSAFNTNSLDEAKSSQPKHEFAGRELCRH